MKHTYLLSNIGLFWVEYSAGIPRLQIDAQTDFQGKYQILIKSFMFSACKKEPTTPTDPNCGFTPNLARFIKTSDKPKQMARPDSSMSFSSTTTYSHSISEADSGIV